MHKTSDSFVESSVVGCIYAIFLVFFFSFFFGERGKGFHTTQMGFRLKHLRKYLVGVRTK